jgi:hypothetical protein
MPVTIALLDGSVKQPTASEIKAWVTRSQSGFRAWPEETVLKAFLTHWTRRYGYLQQTEFLKNLKDYSEQIELLIGVKEVGDWIKTWFPPEEWLYVGVGRSPTPFLAYLENEGCATVGIPLSDFRAPARSPSITDAYLGSVAASRLKPNEEALLDQHLSRYLLQTPARAKILVIDFTIQAHSLVAAHEQIERFMCARRSAELQVHALALHRPGDRHYAHKVEVQIGTVRSAWRNPVDYWYNSAKRVDFRNKWHTLGIDQVVSGRVRQDLLSQAMRRESFDGLAGYSSYRILSGAQPPATYLSDNTGLSGFDILKEVLEDAPKVQAGA